MTIRLPWLAHLLPWVTLTLALLALVAWVNPRVESRIREAERNEGSSRLTTIEEAQKELGRRPVYRFIYGESLPIPVSYLRKAWEGTWRPRLFALLTLGGGLLCVTCNLLQKRTARAKVGADQRPTEGLVAIVLGAGATAVIVLLALPMATRSVYVYDDLAAFYLPTRQFFADSLALADDPTWCPLLNCGFDLHGEGQVGLYHPWHQFLYRTLPLDLAFNLEIVAGNVFAFVGMVFLLRRWGLSWASTLFGAFTFAFGANLRRYVHVNAVGVTSHIPWLLLCIDVLAVDPDRRKVLWARAGVSLLTASQLLLGHPQSVLFSVLIEGLYLVLHIGRTRSVGVALDYAVAKLVGLMLGAVQLLPTFESLRHSTRSALDLTTMLDHRASFSLHPLNLLLLVCPYAFASGRALPLVVPENVFSPYVWPPLSEKSLQWSNAFMHEFGLYAGLTPVVLILGLFASRPRAARDGPHHINLIAFCGLLMLLGTVLALGRFSPLFIALSRIPIFNLFRCSSRYAVLIALGLSIGSACGLERLFRHRDHPFRCLDWSILVPVAVLLSANLLAAVLRRVAGHDPNGVLVDFVPGPLTFLLNPMLAVSILGLFILARRGVRSAAVFLALAHVADLSFYNFRNLYDNELWTPKVADFVAADKVPPEWFQGRVFVKKGPPNCPALRGVRVANSYRALASRNQLDYQDPKVQRVAGVGWVLPSEVIADASPVPGGPLPEFRLVSQVRVSYDPGRDLAAIDVETTALVAESDDVSVGPGRPGSVQVESRTNAECRVKTRTDSSQLLVVATRHHPGWKAFIDGVPAKVVRVNGDFMGCVVSAGEHEVGLKWEPSSHHVGWLVSGLGLVLLLVSPLLPVGVSPWISPDRGRQEVRQVNGGGDDVIHVSREEDLQHDSATFRHSRSPQVSG